MFGFFFQMGPYAIPLVLLAIVVAVLTVLRAGQVSKACCGNETNLQEGINAIVFWGSVAAVLGFLGQFQGMYNGLRAMAAATELSPFVIAGGLAESFSTTLFGLIIFLFSALAWFTLGTMARRASTRTVIEAENNKAGGQGGTS